jgi:putative ATPase
VAEGVFVSPVEVLTTGPTDRTVDRWLQRTLSQVGEQLAGIRDRIFTLAQLQRHHVILDLNAGSGLLTFEALRRVPEGGVYACTRTSAEAVALQEQVAALPLLKRPFVLSSTLTHILHQSGETPKPRMTGVKNDTESKQVLSSQE